MIVIYLALFCRFTFITGYGENLPNFKHLFKCNLNDVCSYVTNAGLSPSVRAAAKAIEKPPQSTWFDCYCTGCTLTDIAIVGGWVMSHIWCKNSRGIFPLLRESLLRES